MYQGLENMDQDSSKLSVVEHILVSGLLPPVKASGTQMHLNVNLDSQDLPFMSPSLFDSRVLV